MKLRSLTTLLIAGTLIAFSAIAAACGSDNGSGGDTLSLEDYMAEFDILDDQYENRGSELGRRLEEDIAPVVSDEAAVADFFRELFADGSQALSALVIDIDALNPPPEAKEIHNRAVTAGRAMAAAISDLADQLRDASSEADFIAAFESSAVDTAGEAFFQACADMQALANENGIEVTFYCVE